MIIICDDDHRYAKILADAVEEVIVGGVVIVGGCEELIDLLCDSQDKNLYPDLIFLDLQMVPSTGIECLQIMKGRYVPVPVITMSADVAPSKLTEIHEEGAKGFMPKFYDREELKDYLKAVNTIWLKYAKVKFPTRESSTNVRTNKRTFAEPIQ